MIIRKLFKFEGAHIVRDCSSNRCKKSIHGHSYIVEIKFTADRLDNGQMVVDFGLLKGTVKDIIDSFDHSYSLWEKEKDDFKDFIKSHSERYVIMPVSPTAEMYSVMFFALIYEIINGTKFMNGEDNVKLVSVRVHETDTGWAESDIKDYYNIWLAKEYDISDIIFSEGIKNEWKDYDMWEKLLKFHARINQSSKAPFINPSVKLEYNI